MLANYYESIAVITDESAAVEPAPNERIEALRPDRPTVRFTQQRQGVLQLKIDDKGCWHRCLLTHARPNMGSWRQQSMGLARSACDKAVGDSYYSFREESYEGDLCKDGCFTPAELREAKLWADHETERVEKAEEGFRRERAEWLKKNEADREERIRIKTGGAPPLPKTEEDE